MAAPVEFETRPIPRLLWTYALPAIVGQLIASLYNIADRVILGQSVGPLAIAGLAITLPVMNIIHAFGSLVGAGSAARMSIVLGRKDIRWAEKILGNSILLTLFFGLLFVSGGYLFLNPILAAFGASPDTIAYARDYMRIVLPGMFLVTLTFNLTGMIRSSGYPTKSMWILAGGALLNIALDLLFILWLHLGIKGAAWATTASMAVSALFAVAHFIPPCPHSSRHQPSVALRSHAWQPQGYIVRNILAIGSSPFLMNVAASGVAVVINHQLLRYGGDLAVGAYGIINSASLVVFLLMMGICQGMQPIAGYNYGAGLHQRLRQVFRLTMTVCLAAGLIGAIGCCAFPRLILRCFTTDPALLEMGAPAMRLLTVMFPLIAFTVINSQFFQSIDKPWIAIVTSLSRQVLFLVPMMYVVPRLFTHWHLSGLTGVWASCTVSDLLGALLSALLLYSQRRVFRDDYVAPPRQPRKERGPTPQASLQNTPQENPQPQPTPTSQPTPQPSSESMIPNTFHLPATADRYLVLHDEASLAALFNTPHPPDPFYVVGGASNIVFSRHYHGTVIRPDLHGFFVGANPWFELPSDAGDDDRFVSAAAGERWDPFVRRCVANHCYGLENLAAIPGTVGAAPVQNVGAYGSEAADCIYAVRAFDTHRRQVCLLSAYDCHFAYRDSLFKRQQGRFVVLQVCFRLAAHFHPHLAYKALAEAVRDSAVRDAADDRPLTADEMVTTVTGLRWSKLPHPDRIGSAGSFFKNPVVSATTYQQLKSQHPDLVAFPQQPAAHPAAADGTACYKLSAGWLIEQAGWKGYRQGDCGVYDRQALVLVNYGGASGYEVKALADAIIKDVSNKYRVTLQPEVIIL